MNFYKDVPLLEVTEAYEWNRKHKASPSIWKVVRGTEWGKIKTRDECYQHIKKWYHGKGIILVQVNEDNSVDYAAGHLLNLEEISGKKETDVNFRHFLKTQGYV